MADKLNKDGLIFIPDISGFTRFVSDTEIEHSQHIIKELIEVILDANKLNFQVSEIEGDAVLFYRLGKPPTASDIAEQAQHTFTKFHTYLNVIERDRVCHCGACSNASGLTLKMIVHYGAIGVSHIQGFKKLMGKSVIEAHRLLKNDIEADEYLLMTDNYFSNLQVGESETHFTWDRLTEGHQKYEHIGELHFHYIILSPLREVIPPAPKSHKPEKYPDPIIVENYIDAPQEFIYQIIVDLSERIEWTNGLKEIEYDKEAIHRIGMRHICELPGGKVELETVLSNAEDGTITYAERSQQSFLLPNATSYFLLKESDIGTLFRIEFHYQRQKIIGGLIDYLLRGKLANNLILSAKKLKELCENRYNDKTSKRK